MARYKLDHAAFGRQVLKSGFMQAEMLARAERVKEVAESIAPVGTPYEDDDHAGRYKGSFSARVYVREGASGRAIGRVESSDPAALSIEFGHLSGAQGDANRRHVEGHYTLTKALDGARE